MAANFLTPDIAYPGYTAQQQAIDFSRQLAQAKIGQASQDLPGQMVSGHYVAPSWSQQLSRVIQGMTGYANMDQANKQQMDLSQKYGQGMQSTMGALAGALMGTNGAHTDNMGVSGDPSAPTVPDTPDGFTPPQIPQSSGGDMSTSGSAPNSLGVSPQQLSAALMLGGSDEIVKAMLDRGKLTDAMKELISAGMQPGTSEYQRAMQQKIAPQQAFRPNTVVYNPSSGGYEHIPNIPQSSIGARDSNGNWTFQVNPQLQAGITADSAAEAQGKSQYQVLSGYQNGQPTYTTAANVANQVNGTGQQPQQGVQTGRFQGYSAPGMGQPQSQGAIRPGLAPGQAEAQSTFAVQGAKRASDLVTAAQGAGDQIYLYDKLNALMADPNLKTGLGSEWQNELTNRVATLPGGQALLSNKTLDNNAKFYEAKKLLTQNMLRTWQQAGGSGTDIQLKMQEMANPNIEMPKQTIQDILKLGRAGAVALQTKSRAQTQWMAQDPSNITKQQEFENAWQQSYDPRMYVMQSMGPKEAQAFVSKLSPQEAQQLAAKIRAAKTNGWIN